MASNTRCALDRHRREGLVAGERHGQGRPDEEGEHPGVRAVVDAGRIAVGDEEDAHLDGRGGSGREGEDDHGAPVVQVLHGRQDQERPEQVELLLDGERPEMAQRRGRAELGEVRDVVEDEPPVAEVEDARRQIAAEGAQLAAIEQRGPSHRDEQHYEEGREQSTGAADPELSQGDPAVPSVLGDQEVGDQVARQHEEDLHAEQTARRPPEVEVEDDDRQDGDGPDAIQTGKVGTGPLDRPRHGGPGGGLSVAAPSPADYPPATAVPASRRGTDGYGDGKQRSSHP